MISSSVSMALGIRPPSRLGNAVDAAPPALTPFTDSITYNGSAYSISGTKAGTINGSDEYVVPSGCSSIDIIAIGKGGEGAVTGTGGGGGGYAAELGYSVNSGDELLISMIDYTILYQTDGTTPIVMAGAGGHGETNGTYGYAVIGSVLHIGGTAGTNGGNSGGGGGGSSGGSSENGNDGQTATDNNGAPGGEAPAGGYAGARGGDSGLTGDNAEGFGAGGGGAGDGGAGGTGAPGVIIISGEYEA